MPKTITVHGLSEIMAMGQCYGHHNPDERTCRGCFVQPRCIRKTKQMEEQRENRETAPLVAETPVDHIRQRFDEALVEVDSGTTDEYDYWYYAKSRDHKDNLLLQVHHGTGAVRIRCGQDAHTTQEPKTLDEAAAIVRVGLDFLGVDL